MAQFNPNDPTYQREIQRARAKSSSGPSRISRFIEGDIAAKHAQSQLNRQQIFRGLALQSQLSKQRFNQALARADQFDKSLALERNKLGFRQSEFENELANTKRGINQTLAFGLIGTGIGVLEGRRREKELQRSLANQALFRARLNQLLENSIIAYSPGFYATSEEQ